jgi:N-acetylmuramoyl-L-alanine amidase
LKPTFIIVFCLIACGVFSQTIEACKKRFDTYLNFKGSLNSSVKFETNAIYFLDEKGKKELAIYANELTVLADFFENSSISQQEGWLKIKGLNRYTKRQRDSLLIYIDNRKKLHKQKRNLPLQGYRIAIDPGHFSINLKDAQIEQKYLCFLRDSLNDPTDTIKLFESVLTFNTAQLLKAKLEAQGATVFLTRNQNNYTSFNCSYNDWLVKHKQRMLDSLKNSQLITNEIYTKLNGFNDYKLFWEFFRDYDLANRALKINEFNPHVSVIIHYNVDETNRPWKKTTDKNYTMTFIGGAFTEDNLKKTESKLNFLRLLLTSQLHQSEKLAAETVKNFNKNLNIPIASTFDAVYLKENCLTLKSNGVFSRNLILCRKINSPLVYGESLYQDNEKEAKELMRNDLDVNGIKTNKRILIVTNSYYDAVFNFLKSGGSGY